VCGRYGFTSPREQSTIDLIAATRAERLGEHVEELLVPRYNIAPSQPVLAARTWGATGSDERRVDVFRWGLIPSWAKDPKIGTSLANARAETVAEKPSFRGAWKKGRRCLVFADAFYEWQDLGDVHGRPRNGDPGHRREATRRALPRSPRSSRTRSACRTTRRSPSAGCGRRGATRRPRRTTRTRGCRR
jgi:putative SOS response-associated peptidase YedK